MNKAASGFCYSDRRLTHRPSQLTALEHDITQKKQEQAEIFNRKASWKTMPKILLVDYPTTMGSQ